MAGFSQTQKYGDPTSSNYGYSSGSSSSTQISSIPSTTGNVTDFSKNWQYDEASSTKSEYSGASSSSTQKSRAPSATGNVTSFPQRQSYYATPSTFEYRKNSSSTTQSSETPSVTGAMASFSQTQYRDVASLEFGSSRRPSSTTQRSREPFATGEMAAFSPTQYRDVASSEFGTSRGPLSTTQRSRETFATGNTAGFSENWQYSDQRSTKSVSSGGTSSTTQKFSVSSATSYGKGSVQSKEDISRKYSTLHLDKASKKPSYVPLEYGTYKGMIPENSALNVPHVAQGKAIPLCLPNSLSWDPITGEIRKTQDKRRSLYVVPTAVEILKAIKKPVCVVSIAGPCRGGKSYILADVFGEPDVFSIGHKMDPETMGLWMWIVRQEFKDSSGREFTVILLDSEGINAVTAEGQNDNQIFTLTVLLASVLIYNSVGVPKRNDLDDLNFIVQLSQRIRIRSKGGCGDEEQFRDTFPFFIWLLRDMSQKLPSDCRDLNHFFSKRVFKESENTTSDEEGRQIATESILKLFSGFEAFALPSPTSDIDVMENLRNSKEKLNPSFLTGLKQLESFLKSKLAPKSSIHKGEKITGEALGTLVELYTEAINDPNSIPNVETAWETYVKRKCSEAKKGALKIYDEHMNQLMYGRLPCDNDEILENHEVAQRKSMEAFEKETAELISTNIESEFTELMKSTQEKVKTWKDKNALRSRESCQYLLRWLRVQYLDPVLNRVSSRNGSCVRYAEITKAMDTIRNEFYRQAFGARDVRADEFYKFNQLWQEDVKKYEAILWKMQDYDASLARERMAVAYQDKEKMRLQADIAEMGKREEAWQRKMTMLERRQWNELEALKERAKADKKALNKKMEMMREAGIQRQWQYQRQVDAAAERERRTNRALQEMRQACNNERRKVPDQKTAFGRERQCLTQESRSTQRQIQSQINAFRERERQQNDALRNLSQQRQNDRREMESMRNQMESLQIQLDEANNPGFFRSIWKILF